MPGARAPKCPSNIENPADRESVLANLVTVDLGQSQRR
jgi:hypothetical protein